MARGPAPVLLHALLFSLGFMKPAVMLLGFVSVATDFIFVALLLVWGWTLVRRRARFEWDPAFGWLGVYFGAMLLSAVVAGDPSTSAPKLLTQVYLLGLAVILTQLVTSRAALRSAIGWWLAGSAVVAAIGCVSLASFLVDPGNALYAATRFHFGTLQPGAYPRLSISFANANMACNYLTVSLVLLLLARKLGWIGRGTFLWFGAAILLCAAATISPGIGGVLMVLWLWVWLDQRKQRPRRASLALAVGVGAATLFVAATAATPILHPTAPFLIDIPFSGTKLAPSGRLMVWIDAWRNFSDHPLFGQGIGGDAVHVRYLNPSGEQEHLTDAHNIFLSIAAQCGFIGLAALGALIVHAARRARPMTFAMGEAAAVRTALGLGLAVAFLYEGLGGSFEDARHLWVLLGLLLAASRVAQSPVGT